MLVEWENKLGKWLYTIGFYMKFKNPSPTWTFKTFLLFFLASPVRDLQGLQTLLFSLVENLKS